MGGSGERRKRAVVIAAGSRLFLLINCVGSWNCQKTLMAKVCQFAVGIAWGRGSPFLNMVMVMVMEFRVPPFLFSHPFFIKARYFCFKFAKFCMGKSVLPSYPIRLIFFETYKNQVFLKCFENHKSFCFLLRWVVRVWILNNSGRINLD